MIIKCVSGGAFSSRRAENLIHIFDAANLLRVQKFQLVRVEEDGVAVVPCHWLSAPAGVLASRQRLGGAMHAGDVRQIGTLQHVRIVSLADVEEIKSRLVGRELDLIDHSAEVIVVRHQLIVVEELADQREPIEHRHRHPRDGQR